MRVGDSYEVKVISGAFHVGTTFLSSKYFEHHI